MLAMKIDRVFLLFSGFCWISISAAEKCMSDSFNLLGGDSYIKYFGSLPQLVELSSCQYIRRNSEGYVTGVLRSYSTEAQATAMSYFGKEMKNGAEMHIRLLGNAERVKQRRGKPNSELFWCDVIDTRQNTYTVFMNGIKIREIKFDNLDPIPGGGELRLGKSKDKTLPGYQGTMRNIMMWARKLTAEEIAGIYKFNICPDDAIVKIHHGNVQLYGSFGKAKQECMSSSFTFHGTDSYIKYVGTLPNLSTFSMCQYMESNSDGHILGVVRSYSTSTKENEMLFYGRKTKTGAFMEVYIGGQILKVPMKLPPNRELFLCQVFDTTANSVQVYMNGIKGAYATFDNLELTPGGGKLMLGRSPNKNLAGYRGKVRDFMLWNRKITEIEIKEMLTMNICPGDAIVNVHSESVEIHGDVIQHKERTTTTFKFDGKKTFVRYVGTLPQLSQFSMCQSVQINSEGHFIGVIQSYSINDDSEILAYGLETNEDADLHIKVGGQHWVVPMSFPPNTELSICILFNSESKTLFLYLNGTKTHQKVFKNLEEITSGGKLQYGSLPGSTLPNYEGTIRNMLIWKRILNDKEIKDMYESNIYPDDAIVDIKFSNIRPHGILVDQKECVASDFTFTKTLDRIEYVEYIETAPELETATFCVWVTTDSEGNIPGTMGSYTADESVDVVLAAGEIINGISFLKLGAKGQYRTIPISLGKNTEHHFCLVSDFTFTNTVNTYVNGVFATKIQFDKIGKIPAGGKIIIGQRQGCLGGCFDAKKAANGRIRNFTIWKRMLSEDEIQNIFLSNLCPSDHVVDLSENNAVFRRI